MTQTVPDVHRESHQDRHQAGGPDELAGNLNALARVGIYADGVLIGTRRGVNFITGSGLIQTIADNSGSERVDVTIAETISLTDTQPSGDRSVPANYAGIVVGNLYVLPSGKVLTIGSNGLLELETPTNRAGLAYTEGTGRTETIPADSYSLLGGGIPYDIKPNMVLALGRNACFQIGELMSPITSWIPWTPLVTAAAGTLTTVSATGSYIRLGLMIFWQATITITTNGTGSVAINFTLPVANISTEIGFGREVAVIGKMINVGAGAGFGQCTFYDNSYPGGDGYVLRVSGFYQASS